MISMIYVNARNAKSVDAIHFSCHFLDFDVSIKYNVLDDEVAENIFFCKKCSSKNKDY